MPLRAWVQRSASLPGGGHIQRNFTFLSHIATALATEKGRNPNSLNDIPGGKWQTNRTLQNLPQVDLSDKMLSIE